MEQSQLNWIANFIWGIADDVLRDLYVRGKYRDVILPMTVLRRLDAVLEPTKQAVLDTKAWLDRTGITNQDLALRQAAKQAFYNTSKFTLRDLRARASQHQLKADFEAYLDGFSPNVQEILESFEFRNQIPRLSKADALGSLIEKLLDPAINLSPDPVRHADGSVRLPGLDNHAMGTIFEELVRRFNEENNEEAGEHWTPRDAVRLMARLVFLPIAGQIESGTYLLYDGACGTGGMLTVAEETLQQLAREHGKQVATHLYGQEINAETYAICEADLLLKGEGEAADNIVGGPAGDLQRHCLRQRANQLRLDLWRRRHGQRRHRQSCLHHRRQLSRHHDRQQCLRNRPGPRHHHRAAGAGLLAAHLRPDPEQERDQNLQDHRRSDSTRPGPCTGGRGHCVWHLDAAKRQNV
jgi:type I restriction enzyme M protein